EAGQKVVEDADRVTNLKRRPEYHGRNERRRKHLIGEDGSGDTPMRASRLWLAGALDRDGAFKAVTPVAGSRSLFASRRKQEVDPSFQTRLATQATPDQLHREGLASQ